MFYNEASRQLQDRFNSRRIADRLSETRRRQELIPADRELIENIPLFFLATADSQGHPDCSVKGGEPGFVRVVAPDALLFPDYDGNGMFRSLGNIVENPSVGLLFVEFSGQQRKLRINGTARIIDEVRSTDDEFPGAQLLVRVAIRDIFPNCPRYLPQTSLGQGSIFNPRPGYRPPEPEWKSKPDLAPYISHRSE